MFRLTTLIVTLGLSAVFVAHASSVPEFKYGQSGIQYLPAAGEELRAEIFYDPIVDASFRCIDANCDRSDLVVAKLYFALKPLEDYKVKEIVVNIRLPSIPGVRVAIRDSFPPSMEVTETKERTVSIAASSNFTFATVSAEVTETYEIATAKSSIERWRNAESANWRFRFQDDDDRVRELDLLVLGAVEGADDGSLDVSVAFSVVLQRRRSSTEYSREFPVTVRL